MKVLLAKYEPERLGGGWTFANNFRKGMGNLITDNYEEATHYFITGPTSVSREEVAQAKADGKKVVLRLDNAVRNSRNRNTGMSRMKDFSEQADLVIYQSKWARDYLMPFTKRLGPVILNSTDTDVFNANGRVYHDKDEKTVYGYSRYNRDETKNWEYARYWYSQIQIQQPQAELLIIGQFSDELYKGNFDFYNGERFKFLGVQPTIQVANLLKQIDIMMLPYFNDACSNTVIESLVSGCELWNNYFLRTGGTQEIINQFQAKGAEYFSLKRMTAEYIKEMEGV